MNPINLENGRVGYTDALSLHAFSVEPVVLFGSGSTF